MNPARPAFRRPRHTGIMVSFVLFVLLPLLAAGAYLYLKARDQYVAMIGFSVRAESYNSPADLLGGLAGFAGVGSGGGASDSDVLFEFMRSQQLVRAVDSRLDLHSIYSGNSDDPVFALDPDATIEEMTDYWKRMVRVSYDSSARMIEVKALAFTPEDALRLIEVIFDECTALVNNLSQLAREDAIRYAAEDLDEAVERLKAARAALTLFRTQHRTVDPRADIEVQTGLIVALETELSNALIQYDILLRGGNQSDPRIAQAAQRIEVIEARLEDERVKIGSQSDDTLAALVGEYERLVVDLEFAQQTYLVALSSLDGARADAQRKTRYIEAYIQPSLAEKSEHPKRLKMMSILGVFLLFIWMVGVLLFYSIRDRR